MLLGDATHVLTDVAAISISLFAMWVSEWPRTPSVSYGGVAGGAPLLELCC